MRYAMIAAVAVALMSGCKAEDAVIMRTAQAIDAYCQRLETIAREFGPEVMAEKRSTWREAIRAQSRRHIVVDCAPGG